MESARLGSDLAGAGLIGGSALSSLAEVAELARTATQALEATASRSDRNVRRQAAAAHERSKPNETREEEGQRSRAHKNLTV